MKLLNVLIIDDHPQIAQSYKLGLKRIENDSEDYTFNITEASTIDRAYTLIVEHSTITYDLIFLDIKLPASKDGKLLSGEDLGLKIREHSPDSKIIVATTYNDNLRINNLFKSLIISNDVASDVIANKKVIAVTLTGSERAGSIVGAQAAKNLKKVVLELGGSDPYIICDDADLEHAASQILASRMNNSGQVCIAAKRVIASNNILPELKNYIKDQTT